MSWGSAGADAAPPPIAGGHVDFYGYHTPAGGWMVCGWVATVLPRPDIEAGGYGQARLVFEDGETTDEVLLARFPRGDLQERGIGVVLFLAAPEHDSGRLLSVEFQADGNRYRMAAASELPRLRDVDLASRLWLLLGGALRGEGRDRLLTLVSRRGYSGEDTLDRLADFVGLEIEAAIRCPPDGLLLIGWHLAAPGVVASIRLRCGAGIAGLHPETFIPIERMDVLEATGHAKGFTDAACGFMAFVPDILSGDEPVHLEVETRRQEIGFKKIVPDRLSGIAAMQRILGAVEVEYGAVVPAYANVVAPAIERLNRARLAGRPRCEQMVFGQPDPAPRHSLIVPLYNRIDFMEYQLGLIAGLGGLAATELIYVLDDPPRRREAQALAESLFPRFGLPFRLLLPDRNLGFGPASNTGLAEARGAFVCFLNSDVFPATPDWLTRLTARLEADETLGAVGPLLLFEDGSVQHEGMAFRPVESFGNLMFPRHLRKGWRPRRGAGLVGEELITGACLVMRRSLAGQLGGFDETYAIGDFEDTDLCLRIHALGLGCAIDHDVRLYHLERKSQQELGQRWRTNLTLYNAWVHQCRWFGAPETAGQDDLHG